MTFNHIEIPTTSDSLNKSTWLVYDGPNISVIHDGISRYMYIKNIGTAVRLKEPNTSYTSETTAFIIGSNSSTLFILNPSTKQIRSMSTNGVVLNEQIINLNDYNKYKDIQYTSNPTQNTFVPTCGHVSNNSIVIGGYLENISLGLSVPTPNSNSSINIANRTLCYMYSINNGSSFIGPFLPFISQNSQNLFTGTCINILFVNDNWVFYNAVDLGVSQGSNLFFIQSLGVDFIADPIFNPYLETPSASINSISLPMVYFDKKIFFQDTLKTGYHVYDFTDDSYTFNVLNNISAFTIILNELRITTRDDCDPIIISAENQTGSVTITSFNLGGQEYKIDIGLGVTLIEEENQNNIHPMFSNGEIPLNSDHFLHPANLEINI
jgi:hypothetical protein